MEFVLSSADAVEYGLNRGKIVKMAAKIVKMAAGRHAADVLIMICKPDNSVKNGPKNSKRPVVVAGDMNVLGKMTPRMRHVLRQKSGPNKRPPFVFFAI